MVLYGGAFDPPHDGHRRMIERAHQTLPKAKIWILPSPVPAGAQERHKQPTASFEQRLAMCELAFAEVLAKGAAELMDIEVRLPAPNYTVRTLRYCQQTYPGQRWALLIGQDQLQSLASWHEVQTIAEVADLLLVGRGHRTALLDATRSVAAQLGLELKHIAGDCYGWHHTQRYVYLMAGTVSDAASTAIRKNPNQALQKDWLAPAVAEYIQRARLYGQ